MRSETGESDCVTIDAEELGRGLVAENLEEAITVEGFRIENGSHQSGGGGMAIDVTDATIRNCYFTNNRSALIAMPGLGAITVFGETIRITDCVFTGNLAHYTICGVAITIGSSDAILTRCTVVNNTGGPSTAHDGGGIGISGGHFQLIECYIADNDGSNRGGGIYVGDEWLGPLSKSFSPPSGTYISLTDCTITGNIAGEGGGVFIGELLGTHTELIAFNTDIRDNTADNGPDGYCAENSTTLLTCCDVVEDLWFIEEGAVWELDNSDCTVATEQMTWSSVKALYR